MTDSLPADSSSFEDSLLRLQQIVQELEDGNTGLEESLQKFEVGVRLLRDCHQRLAQAEQKIEILTGFDASGNPVTASLDATSTLAQAEAAGSKSPPKRRSTSRKAPPPEMTPESSGDDGILPF